VLVPDELILADDGPMIVATVALPGCQPERALAAFTEPAVVARWWRGDLSADLNAGGQYTVDFPAIGARLTGHVVRYDQAGTLEFSWGWDDAVPDSTVTVTAAEGDGPGSTMLVLAHGPHADDEAGERAHAEHWAGWDYFLPRLVAELTG
jgi:uncharacterized protein YndB with AHSA1/START domain